MTSAPNTTIDLELADGSTVPLTLTYIALYKLQVANKQAYKDYADAYAELQKGNIDELLMAQIIYTGYGCAALMRGEYDKAMTFEQFLEALPADHEAVGNAAAALLFPKRAGATATPSR